jgi:large subunit ribosomal protein L40e
MTDNSMNNNKRIKIETNEVKNENNNVVSIKMENNNTNNKKRIKNENEDNEDKINTNANVIDKDIKISGSNNKGIKSENNNNNGNNVKKEEEEEEEDSRLDPPGKSPVVTSSPCSSSHHHRRIKTENNNNNNNNNGNGNGKRIKIENNSGGAVKKEEQEEQEEEEQEQFGMIKIFIKTLTGKIRTMYFKPNETINDIKLTIRRIENIPLHQQRLVFVDGKQMEDGRTLSDYNIVKGSTIVLVLKLRASISSFTATVEEVDSCNDPVLTRWLMLSDVERQGTGTVVVTVSPTHDQLTSAMKRTNASSIESFRISHTKDTIISVSERKQFIEVRAVALNNGTRRLILFPFQYVIFRFSFLTFILFLLLLLLLFASFLMLQHVFFVPKGEVCTDIKIALGDINGYGGASVLSALLSFGDNSKIANDCGDDALDLYNMLLKKHEFSSSDGAQIVLRRTEGPTSGCIEFHCDNETNRAAKYTVQLALNDDTEYDGGKICFVAPSSSSSSSSLDLDLDLDLVVPKRYAGTMTSHKCNVFHAVTKLHKGIRYSLFVLDRSNGLSEEDVKCVDVDTVHRILLNKKNKENIDTNNGNINGM